jgi:hypothetical protein
MPCTVVSAPPRYSSRQIASASSSVRESSSAGASSQTRLMKSPWGRSRRSRMKGSRVALMFRGESGQRVRDDRRDNMRPVVVHGLGRQETHVEASQTFVLASLRDRNIGFSTFEFHDQRIGVGIRITELIFLVQFDVST